MKSSLLILIPMLAASCAFRPSDSDPGQSPAPVISAQVAWWDGAGQKSPALTRTLDWHADQRLARSGLAVTLPSVTPDRLEIALTYPTSLAALDPSRVLLQLTTDSGQTKALSPRQVVLAGQTPDTTSAVVEIEGLRALLPGSVEGSLDLRLLIQAPGGDTPLTAAITLRSPPSALELVQTRAADADLSPLSQAQGLQTIHLDGADFILMQVVRVHNHSGSPVELRVPPSVQGGLRIQRTIYSASALGECGFAASLDWRKVAITGTLKLLPLSADLPRRLARGLAPSALGLAVVQPDQDAWIGVYVSGDSAHLVAQGKFEKQKPNRVRVPDHCEARCDHKRTGSDEFPLCWGNDRNNLFGVPLWKVRSCLDCGNGRQAGCDACMAWELGDQPNYRQAGPNCLFCGELVQIGQAGDVPILKAVPEWRQETIYAENVLSGEEDGPISLDVDPASAPLGLRFADGSVADDPEARSIPFLKATQSQEQE